MAPAGAQCMLVWSAQSLCSRRCLFGRATLINVGTSSPPAGAVSDSLAPRARSAAATTGDYPFKPHLGAGASEKDFTKLID